MKMLAIICFITAFGNGASVLSEQIPPARKEKTHRKMSSVKKDALRERYAAAQIEYQKRFYEIMAGAHPDLKPVLEINRDLQIALVQSQTMKFYHLLKHEPAKIKRADGVSAWANFDWTESDSKALIQSNEQFAQLEKEIEKLKALNNSHPQWPKAREEFRSTMNHADHKAALEKLNKERLEIEKILK